MKKRKRTRRMGGKDAEHKDRGEKKVQENVGDGEERGGEGRGRREGETREAQRGKKVRTTAETGKKM